MLHLAPIALAILVPSFDFLLPGEAQVIHQLAAQPSASLAGHTLIATPSAGFSGVHIVVPGEPFRFSGKYGTMLYLVPDGVDLAGIEAPGLGELLDYPKAMPPVAEIASVATSTPLRRVLTTFEVNGVADGTIEFTVLRSEEFGSNGKPITEGGRWIAPWFALLTAGLALSLVVFRNKETQSAPDAA